MFECPLDPKDAALKTSVATTSKVTAEGGIHCNVLYMKEGYIAMCYT